MTFYRVFLVAVVFALITGCGTTGGTSSTGDARGSPKVIDPDDRGKARLKTRSRSQPELYQAGLTRPLELPPDLVSGTNETVKENLTAGLDTETRILPEAVGARIVRDGESRYLEIDTRVEDAWRVVTEYWSLSGVDLVSYNPEAGTMETAWIEPPKEGKRTGFLAVVGDILTSFTRTETALDKYRIRFERKGAAQTLMFAEHRASARKAIHHPKKISDFQWVELPGNPNRVAELLQNIVLTFDSSAS